MTESVMNTEGSGTTRSRRHSGEAQGSANHKRLRGRQVSTMSRERLRNTWLLENVREGSRRARTESFPASRVNQEATPVVQTESTLLMEQLAVARSQALPEERLMVAVLEDAIDCLRRYRRSKAAHGQQLFREAQEWIASRQSSWLFSFERICTTLDLDPCRVRRVAEARG